MTRDLAPWLLAASIGLLSSCAQTRVPAPDKKTDWLGSCARTDECGEGLQCLAGLCTTACRDRDGCMVHASNAICAEVRGSDQCGPSASAGRLVCTLACSSRSQCAARNDALTCAAGACAMCAGEVPDEAAGPEGGLDADLDDDDAGDAALVDGDDDPLEPDASDPMEIPMDGSFDAALGQDATLGEDAALGQDGGPDTEDASVDDELAPIPVVTQETFIRVDLAARVLAGDPLRGRLYALPYDVDPEYGAHLIVLDAASGQMLEAIAIGAQASALAITPDHTTLWIGSRALHEIRRIDLTQAAPMVVDTFALPPEWLDNESLIVVPPPGVGLRPALIDLRDYTDREAFVGQIMLAPGEALPAAGRYMPPSIAAGPPGWFFAYEDSNSGFRFHVVDTSAGSSTEHARLITGYDVPLFFDSDGLLYSSNGDVIDVRDPANPERIGRFASAGTYLPAVDADQMLVVSNTPWAPYMMHVLDKATYRRVARSSWPSTLSSVGPAVGLGADRVAFTAGSGLDTRIYLTRGIFEPEPSDEVEPTSSAAGSLELDVDAHSLVFDATRNRLYLAVGAAAAPYQNTLLTFDLEQGRIVHSLYVGSSPNRLALSDDDTVLWVGLDGSSTIRRVDVSGEWPVAGAEYRLPIRTSARELLAIPGRPESVVATIAESGLTIFDDGVSRDHFFEQQLGAPRLVHGPPGVLFGYNDSTSSFELSTLIYSDTAISQTMFEGVLLGYGKTIAYDADGFIYSASGDVVDVRTPLEPSYVGDFNLSGEVLPLPGPAALMVSETVLRRLDVETLAQTGERPTGCRSASLVEDFVHAGPGRVAFIAIPSLDPDAVCVITDPALIP